MLKGDDDNQVSSRNEKCSKGITTPADSAIRMPMGTGMKTQVEPSLLDLASVPNLCMRLLELSKPYPVNTKSSVGYF